MVTLGDQLLYWESRSIKPNVRCFMVFVFLRSKRQKKYNLYLPSAVVIAKVLVAPTKQLKEIIQTEHNIVKILTGRSQTSWLFTGVAEIWAPGYRETNPGNGQSGTRTCATGKTPLVVTNLTFGQMAWINSKKELWHICCFINWSSSRC